MKIAELKKKFKNKWVLAEVLKENELNQPVDVKPIVVSKDRNEIYDSLAKQPRGKLFATLYTGKISGAYLLFSPKR
jgi:hypothetical protein